MTDPLGILNVSYLSFELGPLVSKSNSPPSYSSGSFKMPKGTMIVFPSYMWHRVRPVTSGVRKSLVLWIQGPPFK